MQHDESRQALRLAADSVRHPRAHARPAENAGTGVHEKLGRSVVEQVGFARAKHRDLVGDSGNVRDVLAEPHAALAVLAEFFHRAKQLVVLLERAVHEGEALTLHELVGNVAPMPLGQFRLPVVQLQLRRATAHEQVDDVFGLGREMRLAGEERVHAVSPCAVAAKQRAKRDRAKAHRALAEKMAAGALLKIHHSRVIVSSRLSMTRATIVHAENAASPVTGRVA